MPTLSDQFCYQKNICPDEKLDTFITLATHTSIHQEGKSETTTQNGQHLQLVQTEAALLRRAGLLGFPPPEDHTFQNLTCIESSLFGNT